MPAAFISCVICLILLNMIKLYCLNTLSLLAFCLSFAGFLFIQPVSINAAEPPVKKPLTLKQAVEKGIDTNPQVQGSLYTLKATERQLRQAQASYLPQVDLSGDIGSEYTRDPITQSNSGQNLVRRRITVQITQQLFDGFDTKYEVRRQKNRIDSASFDVFDISEQTALNIIEAFLDVIRQRELLRISRENVNRHKDILRNVRESTEAGRTSRVDMDQVQARLESARAQSENIKESLQSAQAEFKRQAGVMPQDLADPTTYNNELQPSLEAQIEAAISANPAIRQAEADVNAAHAEYKQTIASFLPQLDMEARAEESEDIGGVEGLSRSASGLAVMNWNLYRGGGDTARREEFAYRLAEARAVKAQVVREIEDTVRSTWAAREASSSRRKNFKTQARANESLVSAYLQQFNLNRRTLLDVLDVQSELFLSRSNVINEKTDEAVAVFSLLALEGRLLDALGIKLPKTPKDAESMK